MKAVGYRISLPVSDSNVLEDITLERPKASGKDLLVKVLAISMNPVDTKVRMRVEPEEGDYKVLGWDVAGVVEEVGDEVQRFEKGDKVWYAGAIERSGGNAEFHLVDEWPTSDEMVQQNEIRARVNGRENLCMIDLRVRDESSSSSGSQRSIRSLALAF